MGIKNGLLMKFGQVMSYCKRKKIIKKFYKNYDLKSSRPDLYWKIFEASYLY